MRAIVLANGELNLGPCVTEAIADASDAVIVAADGGARHAAALGLTPDVVIGDMDSLNAADAERFQLHGTVLERFPQEKDETDLELALLYVVGRGAGWVKVIGALGGRMDQMLANVLLLTLPALKGQDIRFVAGAQTAWLMQAGEHRLQAAAGDTLSLIPLGGSATGVETSGLAYPLRNETLEFGPARGISNVVVDSNLLIRIESGLLLAVHTLGRA